MLSEHAILYYYC